MSRSTLIVFRNGIAECDEEYRNGHGTAPMVWGALLDRYRHRIYPDDPVLHTPIRSPFDEWSALWTAAEDLPLRWWERPVLKWTYDRALVRGSDVLRLADCLDRFEDAHAKPDYVCHLGAIAKRLRAIAATMPKLDAVGLWASSVGDNPWIHYCEEADDTIAYSLTDGDDHWWVECQSDPTEDR
jgi:hypothetical protein